MAGFTDENILNDGLLIQISSRINGITPAQLSVYLGFSATQGDNAQILSFVQLNPQSAYESLLHQFVNKHGTGRTSALNLRLKFRKNDMGLCAEIIEEGIWSPIISNFKKIV